MACHLSTTALPAEPAVIYPAFKDRLYPCYTDSIIAKHVMYRSEWFDWDMLHFIQAFLRPADHFLDVGANTGLHTLLASTRVTSGSITCVEPDATNLLRLRRALDLNHISNATVLPIAASDTAQTVHLDGQDVFARMAPANEAEASAARQIAAARLDDELGKDAQVDLCKIDVEGAEWQVLKGLTGLMARNALPVIIFELNGSLTAYGHSEVEFLNWLGDQGYSLATYDHERRVLTFGHSFTADVTDVYGFTQGGLMMVKERIPEIRVEHVA